MHDVPKLVLLNGPMAGTAFPVPEDGLSVGRKSDNAVVVRDVAVSRYHFSITLEDGQVYLNNLSRVGVMVNGDRVMQRRVVQNGDELGFGGVLAEVQLEETVAFKDATVYLNPAGVEAGDVAHPLPSATHRPPTDLPEEVSEDETGPVEEEVMEPTLLGSLEGPGALEGLEGQGEVASETEVDGEARVEDETVPDSMAGGASLEAPPRMESMGQDEEGEEYIYEHYLHVCAGEEVLAKVPIDSTTLRIGRQDEMEVWLDHPEVSRHHATLKSYQGPSFVLRDERSGNGTKINGKPLEGQVQIYVTDRIGIGPFNLYLVRTGDEACSNAPAPEKVEMISSTHEHEERVMGQAGLVCVEGALKGLRYRKWSTSLTLGRGQQVRNDFVNCPDSAVSHQHARIRLEGEQYLLEDLGSHNGTWLNGVQIGAATPLKRGDRVQVGPFVFKFSVRPTWLRHVPGLK